MDNLFGSRFFSKEIERINENQYVEQHGVRVRMIQHRTRAHECTANYVTYTHVEFTVPFNTQ